MIAQAILSSQPTIIREVSVPPTAQLVVVAATAQAAIATTQAGIATAKATEAQTSASSASTSASNAATSASSASTSASTATTQASNAASSASSAAASAAAAQIQFDAAKIQSIVVAASDETTALTTGTSKITFRMPYAFIVSSVRASLTTAQTSGSIFTVDINEGGTTILSTKLTIDNTEKTSTTAAAAAVISDAALSDDAEITIDVDQIGDGTAKGLKVVLIGTRA